MFQFVRFIYENDKGIIMNTDHSFGIRQVLILILITVGIPIALLVGFQKSINYQANGTEVSATTTDV